MVDFAKKQLEKFGWKEGDGLGRTGDGIVEPVKVKLKRDTVGVGYCPVTEKTDFWWASCYNRAASNISISNNDECVSISSRESGKDSERVVGESLLHRGFLPSRVTQSGGREVREEVEVEGEEKGEDTETREVEELSQRKSWRVSDEELLKACGGRTGHKAARHGLKLAGKLDRLRKQEKLHRKSLGRRKTKKSSRK